MSLLLWCSPKCRLALQESEMAPLVPMSGRSWTHLFSPDIYSREWKDPIWVQSVTYLCPLSCASCTVKDFSPANTWSRSRQHSHEEPAGHTQGHAAAGSLSTGAGQEVTWERSCLCKHGARYKAAFHMAPCASLQSTKSKMKCGHLLKKSI